MNTLEMEEDNLTQPIETKKKEDFFSRLKTIDSRIEKEKRRIFELNMLLEPNGEIYQLASYSRQNVSEKYVRDKGRIRQMDEKLEAAESFMQEVQETLVQAIDDLTELNHERTKLNLCTLNLSEQEQLILQGIVKDQPLKELEKELKISERTIKRKKQDILIRMEDLFYSEQTIQDLLKTK